MMPRAWERLERSIRWGYKRKYGRLPSEEELKKVKGELYASEMIRRDMEGTGATIGGIGSEGEVKMDG
jgi:hypothetical protein